ncbi:hypothetical protein COE45_01735 [Bacillus thuringiensis]|nr:hypothetical protein COE45_01735 [Bacillus thuringiensis]
MDATCVLESIIDLKAEAARLEQEGVGTPDYEALFASNEGVKQPTVLAAGAGYHLKAEVACSECEGEGDGAFDVEALFASQEKAKPPNILATGAR